MVPAERYQVLTVEATVKEVIALVLLHKPTMLFTLPLPFLSADAKDNKVLYVLPAYENISTLYKAHALFVADKLAEFPM